MPSHAAFERTLRERGVVTLFSEPLGPHTTFQCGGNARYFLQPRTVEELADVLRAANENGIEWRLLGGGACLLVGDGGVDGAVVHLKHFHRCEYSGPLVRAEAGTPLPRLVKETVARGLSGLECLAGVPGNVGGSLVLNAGGRHGEIGDLVRYVDVLGADGTVHRLGRGEIEFRYRESNLSGRVILGCGLQLEPADPREVQRRYDEILADKKATQPLGSPNAGCVFRNPPAAKAGRLIDECGLKGSRVGHAHVSRKHANFIINDGGCRSSDVLGLIDRIREAVARRFAVALELEIHVW